MMTATTSTSNKNLSSIAKKGLLLLLAASAFTTTTACSCGTWPTAQTALQHEWTNIVAWVDVYREENTDGRRLYDNGLGAGEPSLNYDQVVLPPSEMKTYNARLVRTFSSADGCDSPWMQGGLVDIKVRTAVHSSLCGVDLDFNAHYILSGDMSTEYDERTGQEVGILTIASCDYRKKLDNAEAHKDLAFWHGELQCACRRDACGQNYDCGNGQGLLGGPEPGTCHFDSVRGTCLAEKNIVCTP